jgi:hypothetical protein
MYREPQQSQCAFYVASRALGPSPSDHDRGFLHAVCYYVTASAWYEAAGGWYMSKPIDVKA